MKNYKTPIISFGYIITNSKIATDITDPTYNTSVDWELAEVED